MNPSTHYNSDLQFFKLSLRNTRQYMVYKIGGIHQNLADSDESGFCNPADFHIIGKIQTQNANSAGSEFCRSAEFFNPVPVYI
jgi:hypothetical protein